MTANIHVVSFDDFYGAENMLTNVNTWQREGIEDPGCRRCGCNTGNRIGNTVSSGYHAQSRATDGHTRCIGAMANCTLSRQSNAVASLRWGRGWHWDCWPECCWAVRSVALSLALLWARLTGAIKDYGIPDKFIKEVSAGLRPGTSALFLMTTGGDKSKILPELSVHKGRLLSTTLSPRKKKPYVRH